MRSTAEADVGISSKNSTVNEAINDLKELGELIGSGKVLDGSMR